MATLRELIDYSKANPASDIATKTRKAIEGGAYDRQAADEGVDLSWAGRPALPPTPKKPTVPDLTAAAVKPVTDLASNIATAAKQRVGKVQEAATKTKTGQQGLASGILQSVGNVAGFVGDVGFEALKTVTPQPVKDAAKGVIEKAVSTPENQQRVAQLKAWSDQHPEAAANLGAIVNIASLIPAAKGVVKAVEKTAEYGSKAAGATARVASTVDARMGGTAAQTAPQAAAPSGTKALQEAVDVAVHNPRYKKETVSALERSGSPGGYTPDTSFFGRLAGADKYVPSKRDIEVAESVKGIVSKSVSPAENITRIRNKISEISETVVRPALRANPQPFNLKTYAAHLRAVEMPDFIKADETLARTYDLVRQRFVSVVSKHPKTKEGLWDARKDIDDVIEQQFGAQGFDPAKYSALQKALLDMRRATNDFIAEGVPDNAFKIEMRRLSNMYSARHNIALDNYKLVNGSKFAQWKVNNPKKWAALQVAVPAAGLGSGYLYFFQ